MPCPDAWRGDSHSPAGPDGQLGRQGSPGRRATICGNKTGNKLPCGRWHLGLRGELGARPSRLRLLAAIFFQFRKEFQQAFALSFDISASINAELVGSPLFLWRPPSAETDKVSGGILGVAILCILVFPQDIYGKNRKNRKSLDKT